MQATQFKVSDKLTLTSVETDKDSANTSYSCDEIVELAGDSIWDCTLERVRVTSIHISETDCGDGDTCMHVAVCYKAGEDLQEEEYEESWRMYTDSGFESAISELLGFEVRFTEQGMQDNGYASME